MPRGASNKGRLAIGLTLCLPLFFASAQAQNADQTTPNAIGRISYGGAAPAPGAAICTGTLVAPDLVLTADHCLRGSLKSPESVYFSAGLQDGTPVTVVRGQEIILAEPASVKPELAKDVAILRLGAPIDGSIVAPLGLGNPAANFYSVVAYARRAPDIQTRTDDCFVISQDADVIGLSCAAVSGNSGAPVLMDDGQNLRIVAVVVASAKGMPAAFAALIPPAIAAVIEPAQ